MKWTEGNIWESITPLQTHQFYFQYKYSLLQDKGTRQVDWETGVDRLADLELMPDIQDQRNHMRGNTPLSGSDLVQVNNASSLSGIKVVHYNDIWEEYNMCFTIWHPIEDPKEEWIFENNKTSAFQICKIPR